MNNQENTPTEDITPEQITGEAPMETPELTPVNVSLPIADLTRLTVAAIPKHQLFRLNGALVTIDIEESISLDGTPYKKAAIEPMTADRFTSWLDPYVLYTSKNEPVSISSQTAAKILASDLFKPAVSTVKAIAPVRLPQWDKERKTITLTPKGYSPETQHYTLDLVPYKTTPITPKIALASLHALLKQFPWAELDSAPTHTKDGTPLTELQQFQTSRSAACFIAYTMGHYCKNLYGKAPITIINANQAGTGKTLLASIGLAPVYGTPQIQPVPKKSEDIPKVLFSRLLAACPYTFIDDTPQVSDPVWAAYATAGRISDRKLGGNEIVEVENTMQIITTGNGLKTSPDIERRALIIDLFCAAKATEREIESSISAYTLDSPTWRADMLHLCHSLLANWIKAGQPKLCKASDKPSFESFAEIVGSITQHSGMISPFTKRENSGGGDSYGANIEYLIIAAADKAKPTCVTGSATYTISDLISLATELGIENDILFGDGNKSLGRALSKLKGRIYVTTDGTPFRMGSRRTKDSRNYEFTFNPDKKES